MSFDTGLTFSDLILRVAEELNLALRVDGDGNPTAPAIPTDPHDLDICKRAVNAGYMDFLRGDPTLARHHWTFLDRSVTLTLDPTGTGPYNIEGATWRYRLPPEINGRPKSNWSLSDSTTGRRGLPVQDTASHRVVMAIEMSNINGSPVMAAVRPIVGGDPIKDAHGWEIIMYPRPDKAYTMTADFRIHPRPLVELDERPIGAEWHGETVAACAIWYVKRRDAEADPNSRELWKSERDRLMLASIELDRQNAPRTLGLVTDPSLNNEAITRIEAAQTVPRGSVSYGSP